mgnify:CR=1 FL=1
MPATKQDPSASIYQLKVTLKGSKPPIWRRIQVAGDTKLPKLHRILQIAMGWSDYHLHDFTINGVTFSRPTPEDIYPVVNEANVKLNQVVVEPRKRFSYQYDFGDSWDHEIVLEKVLQPEEGTKYPRCVAGNLACPPEDVGGIGGYAYFLEAIHNPNHPEHKNQLEWIGGEFDPEAFDLDTVNSELTRVR